MASTETMWWANYWLGFINDWRRWRLLIFMVNAIQCYQKCMKIRTKVRTNVFDSSVIPCNNKMFYLKVLIMAVIPAITKEAIINIISVPQKSFYWKLFTAILKAFIERFSVQIFGISLGSAYTEYSPIWMLPQGK